VPSIARIPPLLALLLWAAWGIGFLILVTAPFQFTRDQQIVDMKIAHVSPDIFVDTWKGGRVSLIDVGLNLLAFVPFGLLGAHTVAGAVGDRRRRVLLVTLLGFFLSLGVETLQVFTRNRIPSSTDVVTNTLGACLGAWLRLRPGATETR